MVFSTYFYLDIQRNKNKNTLWRIAEYYTAKKYSPDNILNYIELDDNFQPVDVNELD